MPVRVYASIAAISVFSLTLLAVPQTPLFVPAPGPPVTVAKGSGQILLADMNRDGHLDLITKHLTNRTVSVLLGNGKGRFVPASASSLNLSFDPGAMALGDVNNDGLLDLAVNSREGPHESIHVFLANR